MAVLKSQSMYATVYYTSALCLYYYNYHYGNSIIGSNLLADKVHMKNKRRRQIFTPIAEVHDLEPVL